jgi:ribosomal protein L10
MALSRAQKQEILGGYGDTLADAQHAFVIGFKGITVIQATELRSRIRAKGGKYLVVKNTLARRAVEGKALEQVREHFTGPTAVAYGADPVSLAKVLTDRTDAEPRAADHQAGVPAAVADRPLRAGARGGWSAAAGDRAGSGGEEQGLSRGGGIPAAQE